MRAVSFWAASCVAGLVTFSCFSDSDDDEPATTGGKGGVTPAGGSTDTGGGGATSGGVGGIGKGGAQGTYDTCCVENVTSQCFCPAGAACNFGWFTEFFPDGTCCRVGDPSCSNGGGAGGGGAGSGGAGGFGGEAGDLIIAGNGGQGGAAGGTTGSGGEGGGMWEACCEDGITDQCFCPAGTACNFGADVDYFPDGTCCYLFVNDPDDPHSCTAVGGAGGGAGAGS